MVLVVADTSALVCLGTVASDERNALGILLDEQHVVVPKQVVAELRETASYEDRSGNAARTVLDSLSKVDVRVTELDEDFPLDDGENAAVTLANDLEATQFLCDEFNQLALVHTSLADTRLVTTPILLAAFVHSERLTPADADDLLTAMSDARGWGTNSYVAQAKATLQRELD